METREFYDKIADSWYNVRHWPRFGDELEEVSERWGRGKLLNIGCAHGADFLPFRENFDLYGVDISTELLSNAGKYGGKFDLEFKLVASDMRDLPFRSSSFDYVLCVASLHHVMKSKGRSKALKEMKRVLKNGGEIFLSVWNKWQPSFLFGDKEIEKKWDYRGEELSREYYLYTYPELKKDLEKAGLDVVRMYPEEGYRLPVKYFSENILALVRS